MGQFVLPRPHGLMSLTTPLELANLAVWYDLSRTASTTSDFIRIDSSNRVSLLADTSGNSATNGLVLTGTSSNNASITALTAFGTNDFTVVLTVSPSSLSALAWLTSSADTGFGIKLNTNGTLQTSKTTVADNTASTGTLAAFSLYTVTYTRSSTTGTYYINGAAAGTTTDSQNYLTGVAKFGSANDGSSALNGSIRAVRTYSVALDAAGVAADAAGTVQSNCVLDVDFTTQAKLAASFTSGTRGGATAKTVTINTSGATGARICGARDLYQGSTGLQPIYLQWAGTNYGYLRGASGTYFSTPSAAAIAITGDLDLRVFLAMNNWSPASAQSLLSKWNDTGNQRGYLLKIDTAGKLQLFLSTTGSNFPSATSTSAVGGTNYASTWVRATWVKSSGLVTFYKSADGSNWSSIGTATLNANTAIYDTTASVEVGGDTSGSNPAAGTVYRAQIYSGIDGTLAFDFNPATYTSGTTFTDSSSNAATITLNGGSTIVTRTCLYFDGSDDYMKAADFSGSTSASLYVTGQSVSWTDLRCLVDLTQGANTGLNQLRQNTSTPNLGFISIGGTQANNNALAIGTAGVIGASIVGSGAVGLRINRGTAGAGTSNGSTIGGCTLGARWATSTADRFANLTLSELLCYLSAHDTSTGDRVALYEGRKWRIAGV